MSLKLKSLSNMNIQQRQREVVKNKSLPLNFFSKKMRIGKYYNMTVGTITDLNYLKWLVQQDIKLKLSGAIEEQILILEEMDKESYKGTNFELIKRSLFHNDSLILDGESLSNTEARNMLNFTDDLPPGLVKTEVIKIINEDMRRAIEMVKNN